MLYYRKLKVYLDTSVISHLLQEDVPEKMADTQQLWKMFNECDCIISWNFKHIVNVKTIRGVRAITNLEGYKMIEIWNPSVLLESEE